MCRTVAGCKPPFSCCHLKYHLSNIEDAAYPQFGNRVNQQFECGKRKGGVKSPLRTHKKGRQPALRKYNTRFTVSLFDACCNEGMATGNIVADAFAVVTVVSTAFLLCCFRAFVREIRSPGSSVTPNRATQRRDLPFHPPKVITNARFRTSNGKRE